MASAEKSAVSLVSFLSFSLTFNNLTTVCPVCLREGLFRLSLLGSFELSVSVCPYLFQHLGIGVGVMASNRLFIVLILGEVGSLVNNWKKHLSLRITWEKGSGKVIDQYLQIVSSMDASKDSKSCVLSYAATFNNKVLNERTMENRGTQLNNIKECISSIKQGKCLQRLDFYSCFNEERLK